MKAIHFDKKNARDFESEKSDLSVASLCNSAGLLTCVCLIGYFFLMSAFKLQEVLALRAFNFFILLGGILWALHFYRKANEEDKIDYFEGLKIGIRVVFTAIIPFAVFMALYLVYDDHLMNVIKETTGIGAYLNPLTIAGALCIEGLSSGFIVTFIVMQYFKKE
ncbi:MAG TPA: hypothetical protein VK835_04880 [Bacteroidia bacterium]|jgi:hypothetical protein|nr:hypothetical protein [Bacteroidia bacterium]